MTTLLFLCTGNTCRSPMAAAFFTHLLGDAPGVRGISAGLAASGGPATPQAIRVAAERGVDLSAHRSRPLALALEERPDLVLCMASSHLAPARSLIKGTVPVRLYGAFLELPGDPEVPDPYGGTLAVYRTVATLLWDWSPLLLDLQTRKGQGT